jgi:excisionase family DNA binding protein|tara:strand:+ start:123 stop:341 length:219 start_codon:yes stop_codon:yes gene_type:complete
MNNLNIEAVEERFFTIDEMASMMKITKQSIYNKIHAGRAGVTIPPYVKVGKLVRFRNSDYLDWYNNLSINGS